MHSNVNDGYFSICLYKDLVFNSAQIVVSKNNVPLELFITHLLSCLFLGSALESENA